MQDAQVPSRTHDFLQVARLVPTAQEVLGVQVGTRVRDALELMAQGDFDQLPVFNGGRAVGLFSYKSLALGLAYLQRNDDPLAQPVEDCMTDAEYVRASKDVGAVLIMLETEGAVLVGDEDRVDAVMTEMDVTRYLWDATHPFVLLQDIELGVGSLMYRCFKSIAVLEEALVAGLPSERMGDPDKRPQRLEDLAYGELMSALLKAESYGRYFKRAFGNNRNLVESTLRPVGDVRNKVFHFRDEVSTEELDLLVAARQYVRRRVDAMGGQASG